MKNWLNQCHFGDVRDVLRQMIADGVKVNTIMTSPPYWGLRSYLPADHADKGSEIGSEPTLKEFIVTMTEVMMLAREVLADDGTMWMNMGDCYATGAGKVNTRPGDRMSTTKSTYPRPTAVQLAHLYTVLGLGCPDIGWLYERDAKTVHYWLRQDGIATRARGTNPGPQFKPGQRSAFAGHKHSPVSIAKVRASTIADGRVPYLRGGKHWLKGAAPELNPNWKGGATPERQEFYRTPEWKAACRSVWARADACCERCGLDYRTVDRKETPKFHIHHVWSLQIRETRAHPALLVLLCRPCHMFVHNKANTTREFLPQEPDSTTFPTFDQVHYLRSAEKEISMPSLFALEEAEEGMAA